MKSSTSIIDIAPFGAYPAYLAARLDGLKTTLGLNQLEVYGSNARFIKGDGDGDETVEIGPIGHVVNLNSAHSERPSSGSGTTKPWLR